MLIPPEYESSTDNVYELFGRIYDDMIQAVVVGLFPISTYNAGILNTLELGKNHFHAGVICLLGDLVGRDESLTAQIAAIAEYSWTTLIVMDDLGDRDEIRRGCQALWQERSILYASQAAWAASMDVVRSLQRMSTSDLVPASSVYTYVDTIKWIARGQILLDALHIQSSVIAHLKAIIAVTKHFPWSVELILSHDQAFSRALRQTWRDLQVAATLKNQLEDLFPPAPDYKKGGQDILRGCMTYPLKALYDALSYDEQKYLLRVLNEPEKDNRIVEQVIELFTAHKDVMDSLHRQLSSLSDRAIANFIQAVSILPPECRNLPHTSWLQEWMFSYRELGNPNLKPVNEFS